MFTALRLVFFIGSFAVSRSGLLRAVVPLCTPAPLVIALTATPPPVRYFIPLALHYGRSLGGCIRCCFGFFLSLCPSIGGCLSHFFAFIAVGLLSLYLPSNKTQKNMCFSCNRCNTGLILEKL